MNCLCEMCTDFSLQHIPTDLCQSVLGQLTDIIIVPEFRVIRVYSYDFVILLTLVNHLHDTNGFGAEKRHRDDWCLHKNQDILKPISLKMGPSMELSQQGDCGSQLGAQQELTKGSLSSHNV